MARPRFWRFMLLTLCASLCGCATLVGGGGSENVTFQSAPEGALVTVDGKPMGKTPVTIRIERKSGQKMEFSLEGYRTVAMDLRTSVNPWFFGNILIGGLLGSTTDAVSGAIYEYSPNQYFVTLTPASALLPETRDEAQRFAVINFPALAAEAVAGAGPHLMGFFGILGVEPTPERIDRVREALRRCGDTPGFARSAVLAAGG